MVVALPDGRDELAGPRQIAFADVHQDEDRLLGQEAEAADRLLLALVELDVADRACRLRAPP